MKRSLFIPLVLLAAALQAGAQTPERIDTLAAATVTDRMQEIDHNSTQTGLQRLDASKINRGFALFNSPDVIKTLQTLPGVAAGQELAAGLYVHGGDGSDNLFLLDGVPIYQCSHLIGLFSSFNSDVVDNVDFYKSGFPARYGGKTSSVVDVRTRDGDFNRLKGTFSLGLIDGRFQIEGPIGRKGNTSFNAGLRRTWMDVVLAPVIAIANYREKRKYGKDNASTYNGHYDFSDFNARLTHRFGPEDILRINFYAGGDNMPVKVSDNSVYRYDDGSRSKSVNRENVSLYWGNILSSVSWHKGLSPVLKQELLAWHSLNRGNISFDILQSNSYGAYTDKISVGEAVKSNMHDAGLSAKYDYMPSVLHHVRFGAVLDWHRYHPVRYSRTEMVSQELDTLTVEEGSKLYHAYEGNLYIEDEFDVFEWLKLNAGVRWSVFGGAGKTWTFLEPRFSMKAQLAPAADFRFSWTEMNQFTHLIATTYIDLPTNTWLPSTGVMKPMHSSQFAGGFYWQVLQELKVSSEGWYRTMDNLYEYAGNNLVYPAVDNWEKDFSEGKGKSWGLELALDYDSEKISASAYYTLAWSMRCFEAIYDDWYPDRFDNRHKLNLLFSYRPSKNFELFAGWNFHSGNHITAATYRLWYDSDKKAVSGMEIYSTPNNLQLPAYHRLDLGFNFHHLTKKGRESVWNISVYNAYCRMNPILGYVGEERFFDEENSSYETTGRMVGYSVGLIPIIPTVGYTLKF